MKMSTGRVIPESSSVSPTSMVAGVLRSWKSAPRYTAERCRFSTGSTCTPTRMAAVGLRSQWMSVLRSPMPSTGTSTESDRRLLTRIEAPMPTESQSVMR